MSSKKNKTKISFAMFLVTIGIVYGDIGTSPMYVMKSILEGNGGIASIDEEFIIGAVSLIIWTITLLTTIKYVIFAMKADNNGEGGIFSLYSLVKKCGKWLIIPAMLGGSALLADGILTPAVTVTTAVEGLRSIDKINTFLGPSYVKVIIITLLIIITLFLVQSAGTSKIGKAFGPVMLIWFSYLGIVGFISLFNAPVVLKAFNPLYAIKLLVSPYNKAGFMILGSVFLAATGAEALYSDMGHVGKENIYASWPFVKACLILNYLGQAAWILNNQANSSLYLIEDLNPFYQMLPQAIRPVTIILGAAAAIIASQALITGSYTLVSEAIHLDLMPHLETAYPSDTKGQIYIRTVNNIMMVGCSLVVLYFKTSARMEAAYGLAITVTMLMTTLLLSVYIYKIQEKKILASLVLIVFGVIESIFFISSLGKFAIGGYVTVIIALVLFTIMIVWYRGTILEHRYCAKLKLKDYVKPLKALHNDEDIAYTADNIVFVSDGKDIENIDRDVLYSVLNKDPKRAKAYWFVLVNVLDSPNTCSYKVENFGTNFVFSIRLDLGFKVEQCINVYFRQIVTDLMENKELPSQNRKYSIYGKSDVGTFKFCFLNRSIPKKSALSKLDTVILRTKYRIRKLLGSKSSWYGLDTAYLINENVPLIVPDAKDAASRIKRKIEK